MDYALDAEQQMLSDSVARFIENDYDFETRASRFLAGDHTLHWRLFADNGWLGAAVPVEFGGFGGGAIETAIISQQFGRALILEPWLGSAILATQTLLATGDAAAIAAWMPSLCEGSRRLALAWSEPNSRGIPEIIATKAEPCGADWQVSGEKSLVLGAISADAFIVSAREGDAITLFLVEAGADGLSVVSTPLHDGNSAGTLMFEQVVARRLGGEGLGALREGLTHAVLALSAELIGAMERSIEITSEYLRTRSQFGVPIGSFQSLQHRIADMAAELELARSMLFALLSSFENDDEATRARVAHGAKALITGAARNVCAQGIQLHGGMGMTEECAIGHYFKRAVVADLLLGGRTLHETAVGQALRAELTEVEV